MVASFLGLPQKIKKRGEEQGYGTVVMYPLVICKYTSAGFSKVLE